MPKLADYNFNVNTSKMVVVLKDMLNKVRWPKQMRTDPSKQSQEFWYYFQNDHGHNATNYGVLQKEIDHLLKQEYLTEIFSKKREEIIYVKQR